MIGKWEKVHYGDYPFLAKCSRCGHEIDTHYEGKYPNFCSNCGLPMNEEAARRLNNILYLCDGQNPECKKTNCGVCHHTTDVNHAVNFQPIVNNDSGQNLGYMEIEPVETTSSEWIPITFRQTDDEEYEKTREVYDSYWADLPREECKVYDCRMPDDGQEVLITTSWGAVCEDTYHTDDVLAGFEDHDDPDDVIAWMPKPEAYKKEDAK